MEDTDPKQLLDELEIHQIEPRQRLEESQSRYVDLYDFAPVGYCTIDLDGYILEINLTGAALLKTPREHLIGKSFQSAAAPLDPLGFDAHLNRCDREKARVTGDLTLSSRNDRRTVRMICEPVTNRDRVTTAYRMALIDITEEKRFEDELRLLADLGAVLVAPLNDSETIEAAANVLVPAFADLMKVDMIADDGRMKRVLAKFADAQKERPLAEQLELYSLQPGWKAVQSQVIDSGQPMLLTETPDAIRDRMAYEETHTGLLRAAGLGSMMVLPLKTQNITFGALTFAAAESGRHYSSSNFLFAQTIANRFAAAIDHARLFAERKRAIAARDAILAMISHDLGNSLSAIQLKVHLMLNNKESSAYGVFIQRRVGEMARLIKDMLDVSSIDAGRLRLEKSVQTLSPLLKLVLDDLQEQAEQKSIRLGHELPIDKLDVDCDPGRIQQVLTNLIRNAIKFTKPAGSIQVRVKPLGGRACFSVTDTGVGIPNADLPHIFDRFTRVSRNARQGTGLGLSIAKGIIEAHGGRMWVESQEGVGTTFFFTLPLARSEAKRRIPAKPVEKLKQTQALAAPQFGNPPLPLVLIVDDDDDSRESLGELLSLQGYEVVRRANGAEALEYLRHTPQRPSCILLDLMMPVMDGWTFLKERDRDSQLRSIPTVVFSGQHDIDSQIVATQTQTPYLKKPFSMESLKKALLKAVA
jgi:PAS domain S-box-containing protein